MKLKEKLLPSLVVAALFVTTILIFAPSHIFLTNSGEFNAYYFELLGHSVLITLPVIILVAASLFFLPKKGDIHQKTVVLLLSLVMLFWLQANILVWKYGPLTGGKISLNPYFCVFTLAVWLAIIFIAYKKYLFFYSHAKIVSGALFVVQAVYILILIFNQPEMIDTKRYEIDETNEFTFSEKNNVIIMILDTYQSDVFQKIVNEDQSYKNIFNGFTYFRNSMSAFPTTYASISNIMTGQYYDNSVPFHEFLRNAYFSTSSIPKVMTDNGFKVESYSSLDYLDNAIFSNVRERKGIDSSTVTKIYDAAFFRYSPDVIKKYIYNDGKWLISNLFPKQHSYESSRTKNNMPARVPPAIFDKKTLKLDDVAFINGMINYSDTADNQSIVKVYHLNGCHAPYLLDENLAYDEMAQADAYERQAKANLKIMKMFLDELKRLETFDNSLIFVIGDHGMFTGMNSMQGNANPLFLVKRINGKGQMIVSDSPVCLADIPDTIYSEVGLTDKLKGKSIFEISENEVRERRFLYYFWDDEWHLDHLPTIREYVVSGPVWLEDSWRATGNVFRAEFAEQPLLEWADGFSLSETSGKDSWRWCSSEGALIINNTSNKERKFVISAEFTTGYPETSDLRIESSIFNDDLKINNVGNKFKKEIIVGPGSHTIRFTCDAMKVDAPADPRYLVFCVHNFKIAEKR